MWLSFCSAVLFAQHELHNLIFYGNMPPSVQAVSQFEVSLSYCWSSLQIPNMICKQSVFFFGAQHLHQVPTSIACKLHYSKGIKCNQVNASSYHIRNFVLLLQHLPKAAASNAGAVLVGVKEVVVGGVVEVRQMQNGL